MDTGNCVVSLFSGRSGALFCAFSTKNLRVMRVFAVSDTFCENKLSKSLCLTRTDILGIPSYAYELQNDVSTHVSVRISFKWAFMEFFSRAELCCLVFFS